MVNLGNTRGVRVTQCFFVDVLLRLVLGIRERWQSYLMKYLLRTTHLLKSGFEPSFLSCSSQSLVISCCRASVTGGIGEQGSRNIIYMTTCATICAYSISHRLLNHCLILHSVELQHKELAGLRPHSSFDDFEPTTVRRRTVDLKH